jgi:hypothetical protein
LKKENEKYIEKMGFVPKTAFRLSCISLEIYMVTYDYLYLLNSKESPKGMA